MISQIQNAIAFGVDISFYILLLVFTVHLAFLAYHWFSYGTDKKSANIALAVYLSGGAILLITLAVLMSVI